MAVDLSRFHPTFFEESFEGVALMETELLEIERSVRRHGASAVDAETVNRIFRAAHSIKGGSGTFGFQQVADFAHALESILDEARSHRRALDLPTLDLLLRGVDGLRTLLNAARSNTPVDRDRINALRQDLEGAQQMPTPAPVAAAAVAASVPNGKGWDIDFVPFPEFFRTGNDPLRILAALSELGPTQIRTDISRLPAWEVFDSESCYLGWKVALQTGATRAAVEEVFSWVTDDCTLAITQVMSSSPTSAEPTTKLEDAGNASIRVATAKVDGLVDMVGELVITQTMLSQVLENFTPGALPRLQGAVGQLERQMRQLQESVLGIRMLPLGFVFGRLPRLARDVSTSLGKQVEVIISGERTEVDKTIIERLSDPLIHMVRNSIDHGIESPEERVRQGKSPIGTIRLDAYHKGGSVVVEFEDDGRGLNREQIVRKARERGLIDANAQPEPSQIDELIFAAGFSTSDVVNDVSGRGVGLDVVRNNIRSLGGGVEVSSVTGRGTKFTIRLPLTLAIVDGMNVQVGAETYILPLAWIVESLCVQPQQVSQPAGGPEIVMVRNDYLPLLRLGEVFNIPARSKQLSDGLVVVVEADGKRAGLFVDELLGQQQVVLKSLDKHCRRVEGISAATILGNGTVALILDAGGLVRRAHGALSASNIGSITIDRPGSAPVMMH
jgi:two-component system, chemotaxis family, sensor kinase CheA